MAGRTRVDDAPSGRDPCCHRHHHNDDHNNTGANVDSFDHDNAIDDDHDTYDNNTDTSEFDHDDDAGDFDHDSHDHGDDRNGSNDDYTLASAHNHDGHADRRSLAVCDDVAYEGDTAAARRLQPR